MIYYFYKNFNFIALSILYREDLEILLFSFAEYLLLYKRELLKLHICRLCKYLDLCLISIRTSKILEYVCYKRFYKINDNQDTMYL